MRFKQLTRADLVRATIGPHRIYWHDRLMDLASRKGLGAKLGDEWRYHWRSVAPWAMSPRQLELARHLERAPVLRLKEQLESLLLVTDKISDLRVGAGPLGFGVRITGTWKG